MKWLSNFLKLRKQNDYVKIILLFVLVAVWVIGSSVYNIVEIRKNLSKPTEYVLMVQGNSAKSGDLKNAGDVTGISNVTFQKSDTITVGNESIECLKVSKEYLENVYNVKETSGMRTFFLTPALYKKIQKYLYNYKNIDKTINAIKLDMINYNSLGYNSWLRAISNNGKTLEDKVIDLTNLC